MPNSFMGTDVEKWPIIKSHRRTAGDQTHKNVDFSASGSSTVGHPSYDQEYKTTVLEVISVLFSLFIVPMAINLICTYISISPCAVKM